MYNNCYCYTIAIEFQKRGLPHFHLLVIMEPGDKPDTAEELDKVVCAEIPDPKANPRLYQLVLVCDAFYCFETVICVMLYCLTENRST